MAEIKRAYEVDSVRDATGAWTLRLTTYEVVITPKRMTVYPLLVNGQRSPYGTYYSPQDFPRHRIGWTEAEAWQLFETAQETALEGAKVAIAHYEQVLALVHERVG